MMNVQKIIIFGCLFLLFYPANGLVNHATSVSIIRDDFSMFHLPDFARLGLFFAVILVFSAAFSSLITVFVKVEIKFWADLILNACMMVAMLYVIAVVYKNIVLVT